MHLCQLRSPRSGRLDGFYFCLSFRRVYFWARKSQEKLDTQIRASPVAFGSAFQVMVKDNRQRPVVRMHRHLLVGLAQIKPLSRAWLDHLHQLRCAKSKASYVINVLELHVRRHGVRLIQLSFKTIINWPQLHLGALDQNETSHHTVKLCTAKLCLENQNKTYRDQSYPKAFPQINKRESNFPCSLAQITPDNKQRFNTHSVSLARA